MKKLLALLLIAYSLTITPALSQDRHIIDSLQNELNNFEASKKELGTNTTLLMDSVKADLLYAISKEYWTYKDDTAKYYDLQVLALSEKIGYKKGIGNGNNGLGVNSMMLNDYTASLDYFQKALKIRTEIGDKKGMAGTYNNMGSLYGNMGLVDEAIRSHLKSIKIKAEIVDRAGMAASYGKIGHLYNGSGKFPEAMTNFLEALKIGEEDSDKGQISASYGDIGEVYFWQGNYKEALKNYFIALKMAKEAGDKLSMEMRYKEIGVVYYRQGNNTDALRYLQAALKMAAQTHSPLALADIYYNLGKVYLAMDDFSRALSNSDSSLNEFQRLGARFATATVYTGIGAILEKQGKLKDALDTVLKGLSIVKQAGIKIIMKDAYKLLAGIYAEMHDYKSAYEADNEYNNTRDSISSNEVQQKITVLNLNYAFDKREDSIKAEQVQKDIVKAAETKRKSIITDCAIVISLLTILMAILLFNWQRIKSRKDKIIFEKENYVLQLENERMEDELAKAKQSLDEYIKSTLKKNELLERLWVDFENMKKSKVKEIPAEPADRDDDRIERIEVLNRTTILTEEDWDKFKELFEQVHKGFFIRLKEKQPGLTPAEVRLICLTKLNLETKQMAGMLGVSAESVRTLRYRLRKKIGLTEDDALNQLVESV